MKTCISSRFNKFANIVSSHEEGLNLATFKKYPNRDG